MSVEIVLVATLLRICKILQIAFLAIFQLIFADVLIVLGVSGYATRIIIFLTNNLTKKNMKSAPQSFWALETVSRWHRSNLESFHLSTLASFITGQKIQEYYLEIILRKRKMLSRDLTAGTSRILDTRKMRGGLRILWI